MTIGCVSCNSVTIRTGSPGDWVTIDNNGLALRCWWSVDDASLNDINPISGIKRVYIVLPEVFGLNAWVRSVADRLAAQGLPALAIPLFARSAPDLDLSYKASDLAQGRRHKDATTTSQFSAISLWPSPGLSNPVHRQPSMWSDFVSEAMPHCWRPRCPVCGGRLIFTARVSAPCAPVADRLHWICCLRSPVLSTASAVQPIP